MARILKGAPVAADIDEDTTKRAASLKAKGIVPTLAILRAGERSDDVAYEKSAVKRCSEVDIAVRRVTLPEDVPAANFYNELDKLNNDESIHGILMFLPLPSHLDSEKARHMLSPSKDVDGCTDGSLAGVFTGSDTGFPPCTAQSVMEMIRYYGIDTTGKKAAVIGRSLVIGRPVSMMLMQKNATVTICHSRTQDIPSITKEADILIAATGQLESITPEYISENQTVIDVGIGWSEEKQKLCGDVDFDNAEPIVSAISPVPGGVGRLTTSVLVSHVVTSAERMANHGG